MRDGLRDWSTKEDVTTRLLCFPAAGSGPQAFRPWVPLLPPSIGLLAVEYPGHGARLTEPPVQDMTTMLDCLEPRIRMVLDRPLVVFGHSMGALVALELCRRLGRSTGWQPALFVAAGCAAPTAEHVPLGVLDAPDESIVDFITASGGTGAGILADPDYRALLVRAMRASLGLIARHRLAEEPTLRCPVMAYVGTNDATVSATSAAVWARQGIGPPVVRSFHGGHFFFQENAEVRTAVIEQLCRDIEAKKSWEHSGVD